MGYFIYEIRNIINGKRYIGCSKDVTVRFIKHKSRLKNNKHKNSYLQNAYNKYGESNFEYNILFKVKSEAEMYDKEKKLISENDDLYNLAEGGLGGDTFTNRSEEAKAITREKLSKVSKISNEKNKSLHSENTTKLWQDDEYREKVLKSVRENAKNQNTGRILVKVLRRRWKTLRCVRNGQKLRRVKITEDGKVV